jgi:23S rRNA (pseudouridine1915-N3)-methyltransferase
MRIRLICVGRLKEPYVRDGVDEFLKRIERHQRIELFEVKDSEPQQEGNDILAKCGDMPLFAFSEEGNEFESPGFADFIKGLSDDVVFVLGGPDGLSQEVKDRAKMIISLSRMTFTHEMARLILIEQVYRAITINKGLPYHR